MLKWAVLFLAIAIVAGIVGFATIVGLAAGIAKILFFIFLAVTLVLFIAEIAVGKPVTR